MDETFDNGAFFELREGFEGFVFARDSERRWRFYLDRPGEPYGFIPLADADDARISDEQWEKEQR